MKIQDIALLNNTFSFENDKSRLVFKMGVGDIPLIDIQNAQASVCISLQGAHILSWIPKGEDEVIWLSEDATFATGKSVRGGIPLCWPWFGTHASNSSFPAHGFARTVFWQVTSVTAISADETQVVFSLDTRQLDQRYREMWPQATIAEYRVNISKNLKLELTSFNNSDQPVVISEALHTYFNIDEIENTQVTGLEGKAYLDKTDDFKHKVQTGPIHVDAEVDRIYLDTDDDVVINDGKRHVRIEKQNSQSTVVWNPWQVVADKMGDLGKGGYHKMICVESANAATNAITINPGRSHTLQVTYTVEKS